MSYDYDPENIFAKILRGEVPNDTVLETEFALAFRDIAPKMKEHILVIPKGPYVSYDHFCKEASADEMVGFNKAVAAVVDLLDLALDRGKGFRVIANSGEHGFQEVPHMHFHILGGEFVGGMVSRRE